MVGSDGCGLACIGRIVKPDGADGCLLLTFRKLAPEDIDLKEPLFIFSDGLWVPFFIESISPKGSEKAFVKFFDVNSLTDAEELSGKDIHVRQDRYHIHDEDNDLSFIAGWTLLSEDGKEIGKITDFEDIPGNPCLYVDTPGGQTMIPIREELIRSADHERKIIVMAVPEGLF